eukprot:TRINITY_DN22887_c0_g1_i1.p1 TRINITY_DN22887_c0_g1~~TRINITY_DN22887_c0_g1_i1.p1  ORF type:complete len:135 (+),score=18.41 TRINITY_DN22887_c0_g1_i1:90-494(+)
MALGAVKGLGPAMQAKYWTEVLRKEDREHMSHSLNTHPTMRRPKDIPAGNSKDFYNSSWLMLNHRYDQAAGCPSALVDMARRYTGQDASRPPTGASQSVRLNTGSMRRPATGASERSHISVRTTSTQRRALGDY